MTNATIVSRSWASSHGTWVAACEEAYDFLRRALTPAEREVVEITQLEPQRVEVFYGQDVMVWSTWAHLPDRPAAWRYDVLDDMPRDQSAPSVRVGADRPTPTP